MNFPAFVVCYKDTVEDCPALTCPITEQDMSVNPNQGFYTIHEAYCREYTYYCWSTEGNSRPYSWQTEASCYSHSGNVSAFNGIVNRHAFPRGYEDLRIDTVVLTVTLQTAGSHTLTYQSYHSPSANTSTCTYTDMPTLHL